MVLIIGGAYQGKLEYAREKYALSEDDIAFCSEKQELSFGACCIYGLQEYTLWCVRNGADAVDTFKAHREEWKDSILICEDIFCGVVPLGKELREWREMTGRLCAYLSSKATSVTRIFCGLEQKLK